MPTSSAGETIRADGGERLGKVNRKIFFPWLTKFSHPLESSLLFLVKLTHA